MRYAIAIALMLGCGSTASPPPTPAPIATPKAPTSAPAVVQPSSLQRAIESAAAKHAVRSEALSRDLADASTTVGSLRDQFEGLQTDRTAQLVEVAGVSPGEASPERDSFKAYLADEETYIEKEAQFLKAVIDTTKSKDPEISSGYYLLAETGAEEAFDARGALDKSEGAFLAIMKKSGLAFGAPYSNVGSSRMKQLDMFRIGFRREGDEAELANPVLSKTTKDKIRDDLKSLDAAKSQPTSAP